MVERYGFGPYLIAHGEQVIALISGDCDWPQPGPLAFCRDRIIFVGGANQDAAAPVLDVVMPISWTEILNWAGDEGFDGFLLAAAQGRQLRRLNDELAHHGLAGGLVVEILRQIIGVPIRARAQISTEGRLADLFWAAQDEHDAMHGSWIQRAFHGPDQKAPPDFLRINILHRPKSIAQ